MQRSFQYLFLLGVSSLLFGGCSKSPTDSSPPVTDKKKIEMRFEGSGFYPLRSGEYYSFWVKQKDDSLFRLVSDTLLYHPPSGNDFVYYKYIQVDSLDSLSEVLLTIERTRSPSSPGLAVLSGNVIHKSDSVYSVLSDSLLGYFTATEGKLTFTTTSADTSAYTKEFYLMNSNGAASLADLPAPAPGWIYALWMIDKNYFPPQQFFYGTFTSASGHDSDSLNDFYPYPGGAKKQPMNVPSGSIVVTLEPLFYGDSLQFKGASPFWLLEFPRIGYIVRDRSYDMTNVSGNYIPEASVSFKLR
jgi:hypothetical protein